MKINTYKKEYKKVFELHVIKSKVYENLNKKKTLNSLPNQSLNDITVNLKKSLNIIFKYHKNNKRILFIGGPKKLSSSINSNTIHTSVTDSSFSINKIKINDFLINSLKLNKYLLKDKKFVLFKIKKKPELIVLLNNTKNSHILKESEILKIPVIEFGCNLNRETWTYSYNIPGNIGKNVNNIFFLMLNSLFNKSYNKK